jgi:hypothetical protein
MNEIKKAIEDLFNLQEAERLYRSAILNKDGIPYLYPESVALAISALEKQIPKKPIESVFYYVCVTCERLIEKREQSHGKIFIRNCKWCGQKLDWGSEE